ncbi:MAG TPA: LytTR family DNA-binding domain-containing protein [Azospirillaceae bacterium]|nr:LytTR family DNA-binding domain-containing protein [Azospirillaceae bacterium]
MQLAKRETTSAPPAGFPALAASLLRRLLKEAAIVGGLAGMLSVLGPFGTFTDLGPGERFAYWGIAIALSAVQIGLLDALFRRLPATAALPVWLRAAAVALLAAIPASFEVVYLEMLFRPERQVHSLTILLVYQYVALVTLALNLPITLIQDQARRAAAPPAPSPPLPSPAAPEAPPGDARPLPAFHRRIPAHLGTELLALEMEDHYLRIHTAAGSDLVLCRLSDALAELEGADGLQVHRSFWVARAAVASAARDGGRLLLRLSNGLEVPVSRTHQPALRAAGWLERQQ